MAAENISHWARDAIIRCIMPAERNVLDGWDGRVHPELRRPRTLRISHVDTLVTSMHHTITVFIHTRINQSRSNIAIIVQSRRVSVDTIHIL